MEFLQANWFWILLGGGVLWFVFRRGGMSCGMGEHGSRGSHSSSDVRSATPTGNSRDGHSSEEATGGEARTAPSRAHRGC
jgi:hypothetical protein